MRLPPQRVFLRATCCYVAWVEVRRRLPTFCCLSSFASSARAPELLDKLEAGKHGSNPTVSFVVPLLCSFLKNLSIT